MESAMMVQRRRSSQMYKVTERRGRSSIMPEQLRVRKWEGLLRTEGSDWMYAKRIALLMRAWFLRPIADTSVASMAKRAAESTLPGETRSWVCGW